MSLAESFASLARMLDYPAGKEGMLADHGTVSRFLRKKEIESPLEPYGRFVESSGLARLQEEYVATFDFNRRSPSIWGTPLWRQPEKGTLPDPPEAGVRPHGFTPSGNELPDHLPLVLGFLAYLARNVEAEVRRSFISECVLPE